MGMRCVPRVKKRSAIEATLNGIETRSSHLVDTLNLKGVMYPAFASIKKSAHRRKGEAVTHHIRLNRPSLLKKIFGNNPMKIRLRMKRYTTGSFIIRSLNSFQIVGANPESMQ
jgi:hypothetical protein